MRKRILRLKAAIHELPDGPSGWTDENQFVYYGLNARTHTHNPIALWLRNRCVDFNMSSSVVVVLISYLV